MITLGICWETMDLGWLEVNSTCNPTTSTPLWGWRSLYLTLSPKLLQEALGQPKTSTVCFITADLLQERSQNHRRFVKPNKEDEICPEIRLAAEKTCTSALPALFFFTFIKCITECAVTISVAYRQVAKILLRMAECDTGNEIKTNWEPEGVK